MNPSKPYVAGCACALLIGLLAAPAVALDAAHEDKAAELIDKAIAYLRTTQAGDGSWTPQPGPAVTALVVAGMIRHDQINSDDPAVAGALEYIMATQKDDGGFYDEILPNYNTSIVLMALGALDSDDPDIEQAVKKAQDFVRSLQWTGKSKVEGRQVDSAHAHFGGQGYGKHGRPDMSNTSIMLAGLRDSGLDCNDPAFVNAMSFITRCQGTKANTMYGDQIEPDGGFIYATSIDKEHVGQPKSTAGSIDVAGKSRLRTYGSMTYAGFMGYLYRQIDRDDQVVQDAYNWIRANYTLDENPRMGMQGYYYYLHLFARAMHAWGSPTIKTTDGKEHDWANELIDKLAALQRPDGSWLNEADRWSEGDANLCTAYCLLALQFATGND